jgi:hypothetical protein
MHTRSIVVVALAIFAARPALAQPPDSETAVESEMRPPAPTGPAEVARHAVAAAAAQVPRLEEELGAGRLALERSRVALDAARHMNRFIDEATAAERAAARHVQILERRLELAAAAAAKAKEAAAALRAIEEQRLLADERDRSGLPVRGDKTTAARVLMLLRRDLEAATAQQIAAARGGTLGIASPAPVEGFQANIDAQLLGQNANLYSQLGVLEITPSVTGDAFAELMEQDLPRYVHHADIVKEIPGTKISTAGLRLRIGRRPLLKVRELQSSGCLDAVGDLQRLRGQEGKQLAAERVGRSCDVKSLLGRSGASVTFGARAMRRSPLSEKGSASLGGALEAMFAYDWDSENSGISIYGGVSGMHFRRADDVVLGTAVEYVSFSTLRLSVGAELRSASVSENGDPLNRGGLYAVATRAWWRDPYTFGTGPAGIHAAELEAGVYIGGRFKKSLHALLAVRVLDPLGPDGPTVILSFIPGGGSSPKEIK